MLIVRLVIQVSVLLEYIDLVHKLKSDLDQPDYLLQLYDQNCIALWLVGLELVPQYIMYTILWHVITYKYILVHSKLLQ